MQVAIIISIGKWGGVYWSNRFGIRLCLGWIAFTVFPVDGDLILECAARYCGMLKRGDVQWQDAP